MEGERANAGGAAAPNAGGKGDVASKHKKSAGEEDGRETKWGDRVWERRSGVQESFFEVSPPPSSLPPDGVGGRRTKAKVITAPERERERKKERKGKRERARRRDERDLVEGRPKKCSAVSRSKAGRQERRRGEIDVILQ